MDKLMCYREWIERILNDYVELCNRPPFTGPETHAIFDVARDHYMVFRTGWWEKERLHSAVIYVRLHNDKIWIEEDWTEDGITQELLEAGVPKDDIVLAFHPPEMRQYTEFALA